MTKDEALKMAIEQIQHLVEVYMPSPEWTGTTIQKECYEVLNACKEALEQPAQDDIIEEQRNTIEALNMCIGGEGSTTTENLTRISRLEAEIESLKQPAQEPVAWMYNGNLHEFDPSDWATEPVTPLYTSPQASEQEPVWDFIKPF